MNNTKLNQISPGMSCRFCKTNCMYCTIYTLMFVSIFSFLIFWIRFHPSNVQFYVTEASLTQFNLTSNNMLYYNLKVNVTVINPNKIVTVYYRRITAIAWYKDKDFALMSLTPFDQGHKNTTFLHVVFEGQGLIDLKAQQLGEYKQETSVGIYNDLAVDFDLEIRVKFASFKSSRFYPPIVHCRSLSVPLISNGKSATSFSVTQCSTGYFFEDRDAHVYG